MKLKITIKKLIMRQPFVVIKSEIALFPNDPKTGQPNNLKTRTNVIFESMSAKKLLCVKTNI